MNVSPQSENSGNTVNVRASHGGRSGVRLQTRPHAHESQHDSDNEDEDFLMLMNDEKSKQQPQPARAFVGTAGLPGGYQPARDRGEFELPGGSAEPPRGEFAEPSSSYERPPSAAGSMDAAPTSSFRSLEEEKQHFLYKVQRLQNRFPGRRVSLDTPLDELKYEYDRLMRQSELSASVKFQRRTLMATVSGIEYLNKSFNPLGLHLDGWSEQVMDSMEDFDQTFEQLHDKYQGTAEVSPEWNLMIMLLGSGFMFHLSNSLFKSVLPNVNDVARNNPDLMSQIAGAMGSAMSNNQTAAPPGGAGTSQLGASLAMQAMQQKLRPQIEEDEGATDSAVDSEVPPGFEQAAALRRPLPPMARPVPNQLGEDGSADSVTSEESSDFSMSEDGGDVRRVAQTAAKRAPASGRKQASKKPKSSVSIAL